MEIFERIGEVIEGILSSSPHQSMWHVSCLPPSTCYSVRRSQTRNSFERTELERNTWRTIFVEIKWNTHQPPTGTTGTQREIVNQEYDRKKEQKWEPQEEVNRGENKNETNVR